MRAGFTVKKGDSGSNLGKRGCCFFAQAKPHVTGSYKSSETFYVVGKKLGIKKKQVSDGLLLQLLGEDWKKSLR